jgi:hypothetical protein
MDTPEIQRVYQDVTECTKWLPKSMYCNGKILNSILKTDEYDVHKAYYVCEDGIFEDK